MADVDELLDNVESLWAATDLPAPSSTGTLAASTAARPVSRAAPATPLWSASSRPVSRQQKHAADAELSSSSGAISRLGRPGTPLVRTVTETSTPLSRSSTAIGSAPRAGSGTLAAAAPQRKSSPRSGTHAAKHKEASDDDLDSLLADLHSTTTTTSRPAASADALHAVSRPSASLSLSSSSAGLTVKCAGAQRAQCPRLRCTGCDFAVESFAGSAWTEADALDYLWFRNRMPDRAALSGGLAARPGVTAACCQCAWTTVGEAGEGVPASWVCSGHAAGLRAPAGV
ncbi:hypothetical protein H9P43_007255 [Blastocladiella emersonii ATCC 22665]|nr:hypothetical protein H9P43_007255 [Blastocladiella emersonii ATCC 22665]